MKIYRTPSHIAYFAATIFSLLLGWSLAPSLCQASQPQQHPPSMNNTIYMTVGASTFIIQLANNKTASAFKAMLPLTIQMNEINGNEKYYNLPNHLPSSSASRAPIHSGDLMLWGSDCLVLFYKNVSSSYSYTKIGTISDPSNLAAALGKGDATVSFESRQ